MIKYKFKAILNQDDNRTGFEKGKVIFPKGFYYQKKTIVLVGNTITNDTVRLAFPIDSIDIKITCLD